MLRFAGRLLINAFALWLTTFILGSHLRVVPYGGPFPQGQQPLTETVVTYLLVALVFGVVNGVVGNVIRIVAFPLYVLTLGLISFIVNGLLLVLVAWLTNLLGFGLYVESFWWGVLGALVLGIIAWLLGIVLRPLTRRERHR